MKPSDHRRLVASKMAWRTLVALGALYLALLIPEGKPPAPVGAGLRPFSWSRDLFWTGISHLSSRGVTLWLSAFGVKHFSTHEPSDLEYDPQMRVAAEWRDPATLFQDHADNAVIDAMLENADRGEPLDYSQLMLPFARLAKGPGAVLNTFGLSGAVPEGMSATAAMRHRAFSKQHAAIKARLLELAAGFKRQKGYHPPYWELVKLAREALSETKS